MGFNVQAGTGNTAGKSDITDKADITGKADFSEGKIALCILLSILIQSLALRSCHAQFSWKVNGEMGYFNSSATGFSEDRDILSRLDAQLKYNYTHLNRQASINFRVRPELYGFDNKLSTLKLKASGNYLQDEEDLSWGFGMSTQRQDFRDEAFNSYYENFILEGIVSFLADSLPLTLRPGYAYQLQKSGSLQDQDMDIIFLDAAVDHYFSSYFDINYGAYAEYFTIKSRYYILPLQSEGSTNGWRIGPQFGLKYLKDFIIDCDYRFLIHNSKETKFLSSEHQLRLLAGKILLPRFSAFLLIDYYIRNFKTREGALGKPAFLYTPINNENNIYLKLGYDVKDNIEAYVKYGYSNENLFNQEFSLKGWSLLLGIELTEL